jgi:protein-disulfide isomerase
MTRTLRSATLGILAAAVGIAAIGAAGCTTPDDNNLEKALVKINRRLDAIDKSLAQGAPSGAAAAAPGAPQRGAAGRAPQQRPAGPDPAAVYAVPIDDAPFRGAPDAKITIVAAFEFA